MSQLSWFRFETGLPRNPKIQAMIQHRDGYAAFFLYISGISYAAEHRTHGFIPTEALDTFGGVYAPRYAVRYALLLENHGLWEREAGGWFIHDWAEYAQAIEDSLARALHAREAALTRWNGHRARSPAERQQSYRDRKAGRNPPDF